MFLRLLFVLLSALNIAVGAWLLLGQSYIRGGSPSDPGVAELRLLSELPEAAPAPAASVTTAATGPGVGGPPPHHPVKKHPGGAGRTTPAN
jgi:hypothetical protein